MGTLIRWGLLAPGVTELGPDEVARLARLARLDLPPAEAAALAPQLAAIAREFDGLRAFARTLPEPAPPAAGPARDDEAAAPAEAAAILAQVPVRDASGRVKVERA